MSDGDGGQGGGGAGGGSDGIDPDDRPSIESLILSVTHFWSMRESNGRQVELLERHFTQEQMCVALHDLNTTVGLAEQPKKRQPSREKTATTKQAEDLVKAIIYLGDNNKLPRFCVQSDDLFRILPLLGAVSSSDEQAVATRLEALEAAQKLMLQEIRRQTVSQVAPPCTPSDHSVTTNGRTLRPFNPWRTLGDTARETQLC